MDQNQEQEFENDNDQYEQYDQLQYQQQVSLTSRLYKNFKPDSTIKNRLGLSNQSQDLFLTQNKSSGVLMPKVYLKKRMENQNQILMTTDQQDQTYGNINSLNQSQSQRNIMRSINTVANLRYETGRIKISKPDHHLDIKDNQKSTKIFEQSTVLHNQNQISLLNDSIEPSIFHKDLLAEINNNQDQQQTIPQNLSKINKNNLSRDYKQKKSKSTIKTNNNQNKSQQQEQNLKKKQSIVQDEYQLTPDDFISLVQNDPEMQQEFCYLNKGKNSYDWTIVEYKDKNESEYITMSSRGVIHFQNGNSEFITLDEWNKQRTIYQKLLKINFFKDYKRWKNFQIWNRLTKRNIYRECQIVLESNLLLLDHNLGNPLKEIQNICLNLSNTEIMELGFTQPFRLQEFMKKQENFRVTFLEKKIESFEDTIKKILIESCNISLQNFKQESRIAAQQDSEEKVPMLIGDESNKEMPYTEEATIRTHYKRLQKFIKLSDYMIKNSKINLIKNGSNNILKNIQSNNLSAKGKLDNQDFLRNNCWLINEIFHHKDEITYNPSKDQICKMIDEIVVKSVQRLCIKHKYFINQDYFQIYNIQDDNSNEVEDNTADDGLKFQMAIQEDKEFYQLQKDLQREIQQSFQFVQQYTQYLNEFIIIFNENIQVDMDKFNKMEVDEIRSNIIKLTDQDEKFKQLETRAELGIFLLDSMNLKDKIKLCAKQIIQKLHQQLPELLLEKSEKLSKMITEENNRMNFTPSETTFGYVEQYSEFVEFLGVLGKKLNSFEDAKIDVEALRQLLVEYNVKMGENIKSKAQDTVKLLATMNKKYEESLAAIDTNTSKCKSKLEKLIPELNNESKEILNEIRQSDVGNLQAKITDVVNMLNSLEERVEEKIKRSKQINSFQQILQLEETFFEEVEEMKKEYQSVVKLWKARETLDKIKFRWYNAHFMRVEHQLLQKECDSLVKISGALLKEQEFNEVCKLLRKDVIEFKELVEILFIMKDESIKEVEWQEIRQVAIELTNNPNVLHDRNDIMITINSFIQIGLVKVKEQLAEIQLKAIKGAELVKMLNQVELFWKTANLNITQYKDKKNQYILGDLEELIAKIDDNLMSLNNIMASRFVDTIRSRVDVQVKMFRYLQLLLDEWILHQRNWIYLEPVLSGGSNIGLAKESKSFQVASSKWQQKMKQAKENSSAKTWAEEFSTQSTYKLFQKNNELFDQIQKALEDFLEKKRQDFGRFFFLSNESLLEILSTVKIPIEIQLHLQKVFDGIDELELEGSKGETANAMISPEKERVELKSCSFRGDAVEEWMRQVEHQMQQALKNQMKKSALSYQNDNTERIQWVLQFCSQVILTVDAIYWTKITEDNYLSPDSEDPLAQWYQINVMQLDELVSLIKGYLTFAQRRSIVALITQDVHYRDIIEQLIQADVSNIFDFNWQKQLRFYLEDELVYSKQLNSQLDYGNEYYGATTRLVITSLTDKCWMTITGALHIKLGANPQGPAGTGKTESCKDLAKSLGRFCLVFNCSDQVNVKMTAKLFSGLAFTGSWTCLDEFNRIDIEVLSVIAQQVLQIREALLNFNKEKDTFQFFGKQCKLNNQLGIFVTMNPGYAGRTELPDNLKVLFRPVSMMIPNYAMIAEIMLFSEGFSDASTLSIKMTKLFALSSEQLSQQQHYDFGMRALKSVLVMAGNLKRNNPDQKEDILLIKAMCDSNIPKFLNEDLPLFNAIVGDLFQGIQIIDQPNQELGKAVMEVSEKMNLGEQQEFVKKVLQFHETLNVRFGVMLVGPSFGGKTTVKDVLMKSYNKLNADYNECEDQKMKERGLEMWQAVEEKIINPKSINIVELFGEFHEVTQTFTDGLASYIMREAVNNQTLIRQFMTFDGPVDSLWIENLNTVLDDSMTLCLGNGESHLQIIKSNITSIELLQYKQRIKLKLSMKIMFEVADLISASPATVSRCGMVYISQDLIDPINFIQKTLIQKFKNLMNATQIAFVQQKLQLYYRKSVEFIVKKRPNPNQEWYCINWLLQSSINYIGIFLNDVNAQKILSGKIEVDNNRIEKILNMVVVISFIWGFGANLNDNTYFERKLVPEIFNINDLPKGSIFGSYIQFTKNDAVYVQFDTEIPEFQMIQGQSFFEMIVPTKEIICYKFILENAMNTQTMFYLTGIQGSGKTIMLQSMIKQLQETQMASYLDIKFSAQTQSLTIQNMIENKLQLQRKNKKQILLPPPGKKLLVVVDDVNMPQAEESGAQPPIELLRQMIDSGGIYDRKLLQFKEVQETVVFIGGGLAGGGRKAPSSRFISKFNQINLKENDQDSLIRIFGSILQQHSKINTMRPEVQDMTKSEFTVQAALNIFSEIKVNLKPTPSKPQYLFSLKDVAKVFQGLLMTTKENCNNKDNFIKIFLHETIRIFGDRLVESHEKQFFYELINKSLLINFNSDTKIEDYILPSEENPDKVLIYADYFRESKLYEECNDLKKAKKSIEIFMSEINLNLVLFREAIEHISRICRILKLERGHGLLIGLGGSGKQSLAKLSGYISNCKVMGVEGRKNYKQKEFREDLFKVMQEAAFKNSKVMFLFGDQNAIMESFYEDLNNLIGSGEVPACINKDELELINKELADQAQKIQVDAMNLFNQRVRNNVHVILTMSPIGEGLRNRLNMFPAISSQCFINWVAEWPENALLKVADLFLTDNVNSDKEQLNLSSQDRADICLFSVFVHSNITQQAENFFQQYKRKIFITPKTYLNYISAFDKLLIEKRGIITTQRNKLSGGITKLTSANDVIQGLQEKIKILQPELEKKSEEMEKLLEKLTVDRVDANQVKNVVEQEERVVNIKTQKIMDAKQEADLILEKAMPKIKEAMNALNTLNRGDISEIKGNNQPHHLVKLTLECVNCLLGEKQEWNDIKRVLSDANFLSRLQKFDVHNIPLAIEKRIKAKLADNPDYIPDNIKTVNVACYSMCKWIIGVTNFTDISREINQKKGVVKQMDDELSAANAILRDKQSQLKAVIDKVNLLEKQYKDSQDQLQALTNEKELCSARLDRASKLTESLAEEGIRWKESLILIQSDLDFILGNICISAAVVGYLGPFTGLFRDNIIKHWISKIEEIGLKVNENFVVQKVLGDTFEIRDWNNMGLPSDNISVVNGLLVKYASQYPLLIDPQLQGSRWLKNREKQNGLQVISINNENMIKTVEMCVRMGQSIIIEDVKESLDSSLETLLLKEYIMQGNRKMVKIVDQTIDLDPNFKMFFSSKLSNPNFLPEVFIRVTVINFTVTVEGLEQQFLADVVIREMPEIESTRLELEISIARDKLQLQKNEDSILNELANSKGNILDNIELLNSLQNSKSTSEKIKIKLKETEEKQIVINAARSNYSAVSLRGTILYFVVADLSNIDNIKLFNNVIENCEFEGNVTDRVQILISQITSVIFMNISRGLMNIHKQIFSFLLTTAIEIKESFSISQTEWSVFLRGMPLKQQSSKQLQPQQSESENSSPMRRQRTSVAFVPNEYKITEQQIDTLKYLTNDNKIWNEIIESMKTHTKDWAKWITEESSFLIDLPKDLESKVSRFQKLMLIKIMKIEKTLKGMDLYIEKQQGKQFVSGQVTTLETVYKEIDKVTPLIFILSPGADPMSNLIRLAKDKKIDQDKLYLISLGQGQELIASNAIAKAATEGGWVVLQNCHLSKSFMPGLEKLLEKQNHPDNITNINENFRLFLTSNPVNYFPISILQNGMKLTNEPPKGIKANVQKTYEVMTQAYLDDIIENKQVIWKKILFSLSIFHAVVQERRKFGPLGWNIIYEFNESDLETSLTITKNLLESQEVIPWEAIRFVTGEINYGGRVTDSWDIRCLNYILLQFLKPEILKDNYQFTDSSQYLSIKPVLIQEYKDYIGNFPDYDSPEVFGMHSNANIALHLKDSKQAIETILSIQPKDLQAGAKQSPEEMVLQISQQLQLKVPVLLKKTEETDQKQKEEKDLGYIDSLQICMQQECHKFNKLINTINDQFLNLQKAIRGETAMNQVLDQTYFSLFNNQVPEIFKKTGIGYPSLKPLASWFSDFLERVQFFRDWLENDKPKTYWLSAFYFPQGFLTSVLQNYARKYKIPVDILDFQYQFTNAYMEVELSINQLNTEGVNIKGLFMEGCKFNPQKMIIEDSNPGEVNVRSPIITFVPNVKKNSNLNLYIMPIYKTSLRQGTLSTTGHSTNFIISVEAPTQDKPEKWILNGTAFLCQLNE